LDRAVKHLQAVLAHPPRLALVLGSGFAGVSGALEAEVVLPFAQIPGFVTPQVPGHAGCLMWGRLERVPVCVLAGRAHYYEGHEPEVITFPIRVLARWGVRTLVLTNAAGGIHPRLQPGDFMAIRDHLNFIGVNPLRGPARPGEDRFVDLSAVYDPALVRMLRAAGREAGVRLRTGVYLAVSGPSYETPAEIRAFARLGADAVGMSTVLEAIVARQCGLRVAGLSCITNRAAGLSRRPIAHAEVLAVATRIRERATRLLAAFVHRADAAGWA
jgi:purine-nucleoside phosphorylase